MERVGLGVDSVEISRIGFGCAAIGGYDYGPVVDKDSVAAIRRALDLGVTFFDTADVYGFGRSEEILGTTLHKLSGIVIGTKGGVRWNESGKTRRDLSPGWLVRAVESSLRRLRLDCIPLYQIHWPDPATPLAATMEALAGCVAAGKIHLLGCCNFTPVQLAEARNYHPVVSLQTSFNVVDRSSAALMAEATRLGLAVLTYNSLGQGLLSARYGMDSRFSGTDLRRRSPYFSQTRLPIILAVIEKLRAVGAKYGKTPLQVALRWALDSGLVACAIAGAKHSWQVEENVGALGWRLGEPDVRSLTDLTAAAGARQP